MARNRFLPITIGSGVLALTCCGDAPSYVEASKDGTTAWFVNSVDGEMDARVEGAVAYDPDLSCFLLSTSAGDIGVIWPKGTKLIAADPPTVDVPGRGPVSVGDYVEGSGGYVKTLGDLDVAAGCRTESGEVAVVQSISDG